jgi:hypothetical protein
MKTFGIVVLCFVAHSVLAVMPQPSCTFYGQAKDNFGWPLMSDAAVVLKINGEEITRYAINGSVSPGVNFILRVPMDDGRGTPYRTASALQGQPIEIVVVQEGEEMPILETNLLAVVGAPGSLHAINVTAGTDTNHNRMPDFWDELLVYFSDGALTNINQVVGSDDFDGDGMSNWEEYLAGTFAFSADDYFAVEETANSANSRYRMRMLSTLGKVYRVYNAGPVLTNNTWEWNTTTMATSEQSPAARTTIEGSGDWMAVYVDYTNRPSVFRMTVE